MLESTVGLVKSQDKHHMEYCTLQMAMSSGIGMVGRQLTDSLLTVSAGGGPGAHASSVGAGRLGCPMPCACTRP